MRILLVEDNLASQRLMLIQLGYLGYFADVVENGEDAVKAATAGDYALILMDMQMPIMDGCTATAKIRAMEQARGAGRRIPIIATTGSTLSSDRNACLAAGMDDFLGKPVTIAALGDMLRRWLPASC